jgi:mannose-1-phosphate guanylyltransferase
MQIILLSGGSGKRLWPLSNDVRSKQFLKMLTDGNGNRQSIVQRVYSQIKEVQPDVQITIATNAAQVDSIRSHLGQNVNIVLEPERRDTFPAIALACAFLALEKGINKDETVVVLPCDPYTELGFFRMLTKLDKIIKSNAADIALIGIKPSLPTSKYGYIVPLSEIETGAFKVSHFVEKPEKDMAAKLIEEGAYWNGGVFGFKLGYVLDITKKDVQFENFAELYEKYNKLEKTSFDYKVVEKADRIAVTPYFGKWTDIGTWRTLADEMPINAIGNITQENTRNVFIVNELNIPLIALGAKDLVIAASPDGILVSDLFESSHVKQVVDKLEKSRPMYEERRWGEYTVLQQNEHSLVKHLYLMAGKDISYQSHKYRDEVWVITSGEGIFTLDGESREVKAADVLTINRGQKHKIAAVSDLHITEVQLGDKFEEEDIERFTI